MEWTIELREEKVKQIHGIKINIITIKGNIEIDN
jgi:hypothetical protein